MSPRRKWLALLMLASILVAGCTTNKSGAPPQDPEAPAEFIHTLQAAIEPAEFVAPVFALRGAIAQGGPFYGAGEPGIWAALDGSLYATFPGCDDGPYYFVSYPGSETCGHGLIWKSLDDGVSWTRLNRHPDGRLTDDGPAANGDADVAVDSAGNVYASNLGGGGIQFHRSQDGGKTWQYMANIVPTTENPNDNPNQREGADRQWLAASGPGHVINAWMRTSPRRDVALNTTFDGGETWVGNATFGAGIGWLGTVQFAPNGRDAYLPYTQPLGGATTGTGNNFELRVLRTRNGGLTWNDTSTGMRWTATSSGSHWSGGHMAPALDVTGDGMVVAAMAVDLPVNAPAGQLVTNQGTAILVRYSRDGGETWSNTSSHVTAVTNGPTGPLAGSHIFPWIAGGAGDRFAITYFATPTPLDNDRAGAVWSLNVLVFDGADVDQLVTTHTVIDPNVHQGPICTRGGGCTAPLDRSLLDYFESDVMPDGRLVVVYPADPIQSNKAIEIRVAIQTGGTLLLQRTT
jgi:hypothetical protein